MTRRTDPFPASGVRRSEALAGLGLDVTYHRAEGDRLWYGDPAREVWDFLGGYGSTFFGHNHPDLVAAARSFLEERRVIHGQASTRAEADRLRGLLRTRLRAALDAEYEILLASTGSEAVETAARHAELAWGRRRARLVERVERSLPARAAWTPAARESLARHGIDPEGDAVGELARRARSLLDAGPLHLAVEGGYHGMTARALSLTEDGRGHFGARTEGLRTRFVARDDPGAVERELSAATVAALRPRPGPGGWEIEEVPWCTAACFFVEPTQGEGGIHPLRPEVARAWHEACARHGVPLVADEVQSGLGRTGLFLDAQRLGIVPEYVLLGKGLGGGIAKVSAICIRRASFLPEFTIQHASTFAEDGLSAHVACRALELLDEEDGIARAARAGGAIAERLGAIAARHPEVIRAVRGHGLMVGIELRVGGFERSNALMLLEELGWLGYAVSGFLLRRHGVRVAPTLSGRDTIRIEPAYSVPEEAVDRLAEAIEDLCGVLEREDGASLLAACMGLAAPANGGAPRRARMVQPPADVHVGFVGHFIEPGDVRLWDRNLAGFGDGDCEVFLDRMFPFVEPVLVHREHVGTPSGHRATFSFVGLAVPSSRFHASLRTPERRRLAALVQRGVDLAAREGCAVVGLGGYSSIVTRNGRDLSAPGIALTTGNGYTVGAGLEAMRAAACQAGIDWPTATAAVVGATGNIGGVVAELLASEVAEVILVGRPARLGDLAALAERMRVATGTRCAIRVAADPVACRDASLIVAASNQATPVLCAGHLARGPVLINDLSVPTDIDVSIETERPDVRVIRGGVVRAPCDPGWCVPGVPLPEGEMYACMAETILMGLEGATAHGSVGPLTAERVRATIEMAGRHGFARVRSKVGSSY